MHEVCRVPDIILQHPIPHEGGDGVGDGEINLLVG